LARQITQKHAPPKESLGGILVPQRGGEPVTFKREPVNSSLLYACPRDDSMNNKVPMIADLTTPRAIMTGTVIKDVLPVTTLITLMKKNTAIKAESLASGNATTIATPSSAASPPGTSRGS
jgi:hypothetical protein